MWLLWVLFCLVNGPGTGPMSPPSGSGTPVPGAFCAGWAPAVLMGARVSPHILSCRAPCLCCPLGALLCLPVLILDQNLGIGAPLSVQTSQPKWINALCRREPTKKKILSKTKPGVWAFPQVFPPFSLLTVYLGQVISLIHLLYEV